MRKISTLIPLSLMLIGSVTTKADDVKLNISKAVGEKITVAVNSGITAKLTWADGSTESFISDALPKEFLVKGETVTLSSDDDITSLYLPDNGITNISFSASMKNKLVKLYLADNELTSLSLMNFSVLKELDCQNNQLSALSLSGSNQLQSINCANNALTRITIPIPAVLETFICANNNFTTLSSSQYMVRLTTLFAQNNSFSTLNLAQNTALKNLVLSNNALETFDASNLTAIKELWIGKNKLEKLNISSSIGIRSLVANDNALDSIVWNRNTGSDFSYTDLANNKLYFSSFPTVYNVGLKAYTATANLVPQAPFKLIANDTLNVNEIVNWYELLRKNGWNATITTDYTLKSAAGNLVEGTDYTFESRGRKVTFLKAADDVVLEVSSSNYPDITLASQPFQVIDPTGIRQVPDDHASDVSISTSPGTLYVTLAQAGHLGIYTIAGAQVVNGKYASGVHAFGLPSGVYIVNGKKTIIP